MAQSIDTRLAERYTDAEVLTHVQVHGQIKSMDFFEVKDGISWRNYLEKKTGNPDFGLRPMVPSGDNKTLLEIAVDKFTTKILEIRSEYETQIETDQAEIQRLKLEVNYYKGQESIRIAPKFANLMQLCEKNR